MDLGANPHGLRVGLHGLWVAPACTLGRTCVDLGAGSHALWGALAWSWDGVRAHFGPHLHEVGVTRGNPLEDIRSASDTSGTPFRVRTRWNPIPGGGRGYRSSTPGYRL